MRAAQALNAVAGMMGSQTATNPYLQRAEALQDARWKQQDELRQSQLAPLQLALKADHDRLALYADPDNPSKAVAGKEKEYEETLNNMVQTIGQMRTLMGQKAPGANPNPIESAGAHFLDKFHITRDLASRLQARQSKKVAGYYAQNQAEAGQYAQGTEPTDLQLKLAEAQRMGATPDQIEEIKREAFTPLLAKEVPDLKNFRSTSTGEVRLFDSKKPIPPGWVLAPTGASADAPEVKALESGGVTFALQHTPTGQTYFPSQMNDPATPQSVKETWKTIQAAQKAKQDAADKKEREAEERQEKSLEAIAARMGQSEQFQEQMASYRSQLGEWKTLDQQARDAETNYQMQSAQAKLPGNHSAFDLALIADYTRVLAKGGRMTQTELGWAQKVGSLGLSLDKMASMAATGQLPDSMRQLYLNYLSARSASMRAEADAAKPDMPTVGGPEGPQTKKLRDIKKGGRVHVVSPEELNAVTH